MTWQVVSVYADGERVIEASLVQSREQAEGIAQEVRPFRDDQDEMPRIVVEREQ